MKKKWIIAGTAVLASAAGCLTALLATGSLRDKSAQPAETAQFVPQAAATHFTSYSPQNYPDLTYAAENAVQAVVNIEVTQTVHGQAIDPFFEFFGIPQGYSRGDISREVKAGGSGVIISSDGYIVTNHHVVNNATALKVKLYDGRRFDAEVIGTDPTTEVALIKIDADDLPTLTFGDSDALRLGEWVLAIGSPFDLQSTITAGIVSAKSRSLGAIPNQYGIESFIQTDAAVNPGNSGGALVNTAGELVGINTLIKSQTGSYIGYSFAIPSSIVRKVVVDLREYGVVQRAVLGVAYQEINDYFIENFGHEHGIDEPGGVYVAEVTAGGAAEEAGIRKGDVITEIDGVQLDGKARMSEVMSRYRPNDRIKISVKRDGAVKQFEAVLRNKAGKTELLARDYVDAIESLGGKFAEVSEKVRRELDIDGGVRVTGVDRDGILARLHVKEGFIITHINERAIRSMADLRAVDEPIEHIEGVYPNGRGVGYTIIK